MFAILCIFSYESSIPPLDFSFMVCIVQGGTLKTREGFLMALILSKRDQLLAEELRRFGVLEAIDGSKLDQKQGIFTVVCSDGDQFDDIYRLHERLMLEQRATPRPHMYADHGMPLFLAECSPLNRNGRGLNLLESIGAVPGIKKINTGAIHSHAPCAAATEAGLDIVQQIAIVKAGKTRIQELFPSIAVANLFQIDNGKKRSYRVCGHQWRSYLLHKGIGLKDLTPERLIQRLLDSPVAL